LIWFRKFLFGISFGKQIKKKKKQLTSLPADRSACFACSAMLGRMAEGRLPFFPVSRRAGPEPKPHASSFLESLTGGAGCRSSSTFREDAGLQPKRMTLFDSVISGESYPNLANRSYKKDALAFLFLFFIQTANFTVRNRGLGFEVLAVSVVCR
jgi:hypothetical protein